MDKREFTADKEIKKKFPNAKKIVMTYMKDGEVVDESQADSCRILILDCDGKRIQEVYGEVDKET